MFFSISGFLDDMRLLCGGSAYDRGESQSIQGGQKLTPFCEGGFDICGLMSGVDFPDQRAICGEKFEQLGVIECAGEGRVVVGCGPFHIVDMGADQVR